VKKPINKPTYYFDTVEGVDHTFNTFRDHADHKWTAKEHEENEKLRRQTKLGIIKDEEKKLKKFDSADARTYPSDPEQKRILTNIQNLEKKEQRKKRKKNPLEQWRKRLFKQYKRMQII